MAVIPTQDQKQGEYLLPGYFLRQYNVKLMRRTAKESAHQQRSGRVDEVCSGLPT